MIIDIRTKLPVPQFSTPKPEKHADSTGAQWECGRCHSTLFKLFTDGMIKCSECEIKAENITVEFITKGEKKL